MSYHHGSLREALIEATDAIIAEKGFEGFSLRAATRRAGVSPGAPKHHFGSLSGLLTEVATKAFEAQAVYMHAVPETGNVANDLRASVLAYMHFAVANPGHYKLMQRRHLLQPSARLDGAIRASLERLARLIASYNSVELAEQDEPILPAAVMSSLALVHGLAHLALDFQMTTEDILEEKQLIYGNSIQAIISASWSDNRFSQG